MTVGSGNGFGAVLYWSDAAHAIEAVNYNGDAMQVGVSKDVADAGFSATLPGAVCLACGHCENVSGNSYFLLRSRDGAKTYLYTLSSTSTKATVESVREVPADSYFAKATVRAFNGNTATIAYAVDGNRLYSYDVAQEAPEKELTLQGIGDGETITYVSNRYFTGSTPFDYLVVGTQKGTAYRLYFYNIIGGEPVGAPVFSFTGEGKMKSLVYVDHLVSASDGASFLPVAE